MSAISCFIKFIDMLRFPRISIHVLALDMFITQKKLKHEFLLVKRDKIEGLLSYAIEHCHRNI